MRRGEAARRPRTNRLPDNVARGVRDSFGFAGDPETNERWGWYATQAIERLSRLPAEVWALPIDWRAHAKYLDQALFVSAPRRTAKAEREAHRIIAARLCNAAAKLAEPDEADAFVDDLLFYVQDFGSPKTTLKMPRVDLNKKDRGPRLSQFLRAVAKMYVAAEERRFISGLVEPQHLPGAWTTGKQRGAKPADAAAAQALENTTRLLEWLTGDAHPAMAERLMRAYHPAASGETDFLDAWKERRKIAAKTAGRKMRRK